MKVTIDMVTAHGNGIQVDAVVLFSQKAVDQLVEALQKNKKLVWPPELSKKDASK